MKHKENNNGPEAEQNTEAAQQAESAATADGEAAMPEGAESAGQEAGESETAGLKTQVAQLKDQLLRAMAEVENTRRRHQKEMEDSRRYAITSFAQDLLNVLDNFYRTEEHLPQDVENLEPGMRSLVQGIHLTKNELIKVFESHGIRRISPKQGEAFDHNLHQAIAQVPDANVAPNAIVHVVQAGYTINDRLLRPAMVSVATAPANPA